MFRPTLAAACAAATLALPATAAAVVVPQQGMKGVTLGMTVAQVRAQLGPPTAFRTVRPEIIGPTRQWRYGLTRVLFDSTAADAKVISLDTTSKGERTASGVGVGSSRAAVRRKVPGVRCLVEFSFDHCFVGAFRAGEVVTDFVLGGKGRKVTRITVGRVID